MNAFMIFARFIIVHKIEEFRKTNNIFETPGQVL